MSQGASTHEGPGRKPCFENSASDQRDRACNPIRPDCRRLQSPRRHNIALDKAAIKKDPLSKLVKAAQKDADVR